MSSTKRPNEMDPKLLGAVFSANKLPKDATLTLGESKLVTWPRKCQSQLKRLRIPHQRQPSVDSPSERLVVDDEEFCLPITKRGLTPGPAGGVGTPNRGVFRPNVADTLPLPFLRKKQDYLFDDTKLSGAIPNAADRITALVERGLNCVGTHFPDFHDLNALPFGFHDRKLDSESSFGVLSGGGHGKFDVKEMEKAANESISSSFFFVPPQNESHQSNLTSELTLLRKEATFRASRLNVAQQALRLFLGHFPSYSTILSKIVCEYDSYISSTLEINRKVYEVKQGHHKDLVEKLFHSEASAATLRDELATVQTEVNGYREVVGTEKSKIQALERKQAVQEALLAEHEKTINEKNTINSILTKRLMFAEDEIKALNEKIAQYLAKAVELNKQLHTRMQVVEKLNASCEGMFQEKAVLQRQILSLTNRHRLNTLKTALNNNRGANAALQCERDMENGFSALEAMYEAQIQCCFERTQLQMNSVYEATRCGELTPRPVEIEEQCDHGLGKLATAARFSEFKATIHRLKDENQRLQETIDNMDEQHCPLLRDRAKYFVPYSIQGYGNAAFFRETPKWFIAFGTEDTVPLFLRATGRVKCTIFSKVNVFGAIANFMNWLKGRFSRELLSMPIASSAGALFNDWILEKYGAEDAVSVAYSLHHCLHILAYEPRCAVFLEILYGNTSFWVWWAIDDVLFNFRVSLLSKCKKSEEPSLPKQVVYGHVERSFAFLSDTEIDYLMRALRKDHPRDNVNVMLLYSHDAKAFESHFYSAARDILLIDRQKLLLAFETALLGDASTVSGDASMHSCVHALLKVDPFCPEKNIIQFLGNIFGREKVDETNEALPMLSPKDRFVNNQVTVSLLDVRISTRRHPFPRFTKQSTTDYLNVVELTKRATGDEVGIASLQAKKEEEEFQPPI